MNERDIASFASEAIAARIPDYETLLYAHSGPIATITLNRPDRLNTIVPRVSYRNWNPHGV